MSQAATERPDRPGEALAWWALFTAILLGLNLLGRLDGTVVASLLLIIPLGLSSYRQEPLSWLGLTAPGALRGVAVATLLGIALFPLYAWAYGELWAPLPGDLPAAGAILGILAVEVIAIALPEELFFRGYLQGELSQRLPPTSAIVVTAVLFSVSHLAVHISLFRLLTFFPGLVFGWLRHRYGSIAGAVWFHALCNTLAQGLVAGRVS